jgi:hypothetical protein
MHSACRCRPLGAEQIQVWNDTAHRLEHVRTIVYEMGYANLSAMQGFLRTLETETHIATVNTGTLKKAVVVEPLHCSGLNAWSALGDDPDSPIESSYEIRNYIKHALVGRGVQCVFERSADK